MSGYIQRQIRVVIQLGIGDYGSAGYTTYTFDGLRVSASIKKMGMPSANEADIRIWGLSLDFMNAVTTLGQQALVMLRNNKVTLYAGDAVSGLPMLFTGTIQEAWADFSGMPDVYLSIHSITGGLDRLIPSPPSSYPEAADVTVVIADLAARMGLAFRNGGVSGVTIARPYWPGTLMQQAETVAEHAGIAFLADNDTIWIWPLGGTRDGAGAQVPVIAAGSNMIGYPSYTAQGIGLRALYNPAISMGGVVQVISSVTNANGFWVVYKLVHTLESERPDGQWSSELEGSQYGGPAPIPT